MTGTLNATPYGDTDPNVDSGTIRSSHGDGSRSGDRDRSVWIEGRGERGNQGDAGRGRQKGARPTKGRGRQRGARPTQG